MWLYQPAGRKHDLPMASQTAADLRTLVTRRAGGNRRVALLSADGALAQALQEQGATVLVDPGSLEEVVEFNPQVVVAFDGFAATVGPAALEALVQVAPKAELVFSFAPAASGSALLLALCGATPRPTLAERDVMAWLARAGYRVTSRDLVVTPHQPTGLCADTEAALRQMLEQLNPQAAVDRVLLVAQRGATPAKTERVPGLVSVIVSAGDDRGALEGTLASLLRQFGRPLELVVVSSLAADVLEDTVSRAKTRAEVTVHAEGDLSPDSAARANRGLELAHGQYVTFVEAGDLLDAMHLGSLKDRLEKGTAAWALAPVRAAGQVPELPATFDLATWLAAGATARCGWMVDTARIGPFPLSLPEGDVLADAMLFARLAALFPPSWGQGKATVDRTAPVQPGQGRALVAQLSARPLRVLSTLDEVTRETPPPVLEALLRERVEAASPTAARLFDRVGQLAHKVKDAADKARASAKEELGK